MGAITNSATTVGTAVMSIPDKFYWLIAKGRLRPAEPLYAVQILSRDTGEIVAEGEHDDLAECIRLSLFRALEKGGE